jgi:predicted DNA-binding transcriptional regulator YafY
MNSDASAFVRRARFFLAQLKNNNFPNTTTIQKFDGCSKPTAARLIERLQSEYFFPIEFDASQRGYRLRDQNFTCEFLPPGKDELSALFLVCQLAETIGADDIKSAVASLWNSAVSSSRVHSHDISALSRRFSADVTAVSTIADTGVLSLLHYAAEGTPVDISYKSPWRHPEPRRYQGYIERVHLSDGSVYVLFGSSDGRTLVLNASFIKSISKLDLPPAMLPRQVKDMDLSWLDGFGVWANQEIQQVIIKIAPPAAEFYAIQLWHAEQSDTWEEEVLVRSLPAMISPEIVRRVLSIGRHVISVEPIELKRLLQEEISSLVATFKD